MGELPAFVDKVPAYEVRKGQMHITMGTFRLVMPVDVFEEGCRDGSAVIAKWRSRTFPREAEPRRAAFN